MEVKNVKGTKDLFKEEALNFSYIESLMCSIASLFGFEEMRPPVLEHTNVFVRGVGESSDVVRKEMYTFLDKGDRSITLRPEFTAGIMRLIVQNKLYATESLPIKAYYHGPVFRYERPQLGRYRQFHQFGVECVGGKSIYQDLDVIVLGYSILQSLGLKNVTLKINTLGDEESRNAYRLALKEYFKDKVQNMCEDCKNRYEINPLRILDCKVPEDIKLVKDAPKMLDYITPSSKKRFEEVLHQLDELKIAYEVDENLVRGLDYYSETVFEFHYVSQKGVNYGAIGAGGHYDKLLNDLGGPLLPGIGFSFGIERVASIMHDDELDQEYKKCDVFVLPMKEEYNEHAFNIALTLRLEGITVDANYEGGKLPAQIKRAVKANAKVALIIGEDEVKNDTIVVKNLLTENQVTVPIKNVVNEVYEIIAEEEHCDCGSHDHVHECCEGDECDCGCHSHGKDKN